MHGIYVWSYSFSMQVKICGITQPDQGEAIAQFGATALGFICFPKSPRYVSPPNIRAIVDRLPDTTLTGQPLQRVGVFVNASIDDIVDTVAIAHLTAVQLHGQESIEFCQQLREALPNTTFIKAFRVKDPQTLATASTFASKVDLLLLDAYHPHLMGGTGETLNWQALQAFHPNCPWWLAGGLTPENVTEALTQCHPSGLDLSSGVEISPGNKDLEKVKRLFQALAQ